MTYFEYFPLMAYDVKGTKQYKLMPQIIKRVKLRAGIKVVCFYLITMMYKMVRNLKM